MILFNERVVMFDLPLCRKNQARKQKLPEHCRYLKTSYQQTSCQLASCEHFIPAGAEARQLPADIGKFM